MFWCLGLCYDARRRTIGKVKSFRPRSTTPLDNATIVKNRHGLERGFCAQIYFHDLYVSAFLISLEKYKNASLRASLSSPSKSIDFCLLAVTTRIEATRHSGFLSTETTPLCIITSVKIFQPCQKRQCPLDAKRTFSAEFFSWSTSTYNSKGFFEINCIT